MPNLVKGKTFGATEQVTSTKLHQLVDDATFASGNYFGWRNLIINGRGYINQRAYVSGTATSGSNQYTLDRWRVVTSGQSLTFSVSGITATMTAPAGGVEQVIEGSSIQGGTHVISFTGTATCTVDGVAKVSGGTFTLTAGTNCTVRFSGGTFTNVQVEAGDVASAYENRPYAIELMLCQRYYEYDGSGGIGSNVVLATNMFTNYKFKVTKRIVPTMTYQYLAGGTGATYTVFEGGFFQNTNHSLTSGMAWTADAEI